MAKQTTSRASTSKSTTRQRPGALCKSGLHKLTASNRYEHPSKGTMCRDCIRDYMRDYMRERRERQAAEAKRVTRRKR